MDLMHVFRKAFASRTPKEELSSKNLMQARGFLSNLVGVTVSLGDAYRVTKSLEGIPARIAFASDDYDCDVHDVQVGTFMPRNFERAYTIVVGDKELCAKMAGYPERLDDWIRSSESGLNMAFPEHQITLLMYEVNHTNYVRMISEHESK